MTGGISGGMEARSQRWDDKTIEGLCFVISSVRHHFATFSDCLLFRLNIFQLFIYLFFILLLSTKKEKGQV